jgi:hypothetical protein
MAVVMAVTVSSVATMMRSLGERRRRAREKQNPQTSRNQQNASHGELPRKRCPGRPLQAADDLFPPARNTDAQRVPKPAGAKSAAIRQAQDACWQSERENAPSIRCQRALDAAPRQAETNLPAVRAGDKKSDPARAVSRPCRCRR